MGFAATCRVRLSAEIGAMYRILDHEKWKVARRRRSTIAKELAPVNSRESALKMGAQVQAKRGWLMICHDEGITREFAVRARKASNRALCLIAMCFVLVACASTPKLGSDALGQLSAVRIDPNINTATDMYYLGPGSGVGMMFGAIGGAITAAANETPGESLKKFAEDNGVHIDQIVREEAAKAFRESGKLNLTDEQSPNVATLRISIPMYGFSIPNGFSSELVPVVKIECALIGSDGKVIWSANDSVLPMGNPADGKTPDEFRENPKLIEEAWRIAVRSILANITHHM